MVEQELKNAESVIPARGVVERGKASAGNSIGISGVLKEQFDAVVVVPICFANKHSRKRIVIEFAGINQNFQRAIVVTFGCVIRHRDIVTEDSCGLYARRCCCSRFPDEPLESFAHCRWTRAKLRLQ